MTTCPACEANPCDCDLRPSDAMTRLLEALLVERFGTPRRRRKTVDNPVDKDVNR